MNIPEIIQQIKDHAPIFGGRVAGVAGYELARDQVWLDQPAAYVIAVEDEGGENQSQTGYQQILVEKVGIIVDLDNKMDRRGQDASTNAVGEIRSAIWGAILNWRPDSTVDPEQIGGGRGFSYSGGGMIEADRARLRWQFDFTIAVTITETVGFQNPSEPFRDIRITETDAATGQVLVVSDLLLTQPPPF